MDTPGGRTTIATDVQTQTGPGPGSGQEPPPPRRVTRRTFVAWYLAGLLTAFAVAVIAPLLVYIWPNQNGRVKAAQIKVSLQASIDNIPANNPVKFTAPNNYAFAMVNGGGDNYAGKLSFGGYLAMVNKTVVAYSITCPHLGCSYAWQQGQNFFLCPCHGSEFSVDGAVVRGPAQAPLSNYTFHRTNNPKQITIDGFNISGAG